MRLGLAGTCALSLCAACGDVQGAERGAGTVDWPSFRGPFAQGVSEGFATATDWDLATGRNVRWRVPLDGLAHSSPVVFGEALFLTTAIPDEAQGPDFQTKRDRDDRRAYGWIRDLPQEGPHRFEIVCLDKRTGATRWSRTAHEGAPFSRRHPQGSHANPTPAVDAGHVVAYFGAEGLYCYDHDGGLLWQKDLGDLVAGYYVNPSIQWGIASSPVLHDGRVIVLCDVLGDSFLAAYDADSGLELWRAARDDVPTWGTPTVDVAGGRSQVIVNGYDHIGGYDLASGRSLWTMVGGGAAPIPTPVVAHDLIFVTNAGGMPGGKSPQSQRAPIFAIHADAVGEIVPDGRYVQWATPRGGNYVPSPLVYGAELYCVTGSVLTCYDALSGLEHYRQRTGGISEFSSSPVAADGKVYLASDTGEVHVLRAGPVYEVLATNALEEPCFATPAISEGVLYWRTTGHLVAVGADERVAAATPGAR